MGREEVSDRVVCFSRGSSKHHLQSRSTEQPKYGLLMVGAVLGNEVTLCGCVIGRDFG